MPGDEFASQEGVCQAIESLSDADWLRLEGIARFQVYLFPALSSDDLLQEGLQRVLDPESRRWPTAIPFPVFFRNVLRSIADEWRDDEKMRPERSEAELDLTNDGSDASLIERLAREERTPEREVLARELVNAVEQLFEADDEVTALLLGVAEGMTALEVQETFSMTANAYHAARKRLARALEKHMDLS